MAEGNVEDQFTVQLIEFYKDFVSGNSKAIKTLATIQDAHPDQYEILLELRDDPTIIGQSDLLNEEEKTAILVIILKASKLARNSQNLFDLTADAKRALAKDMEDFATFVEAKLKELTKKRAKK